MNPVHLHGRAVWDRSVFPRDENEARLRAVQSEMQRRGLHGLVVFGHYTQYDDLCYLTQFFPLLRWSFAVVPAQGAMTLVPGRGAGPVLPETRMRTWVEDVRNVRSLGADLRAILKERGICGRVGLADLETSLPADASDEVRLALSDLECVAAEDAMEAVRRSLRPREVAALRSGAAIVRKAAAAMARAHAMGAGHSEALIEADRTARLLGATDCRGLAVVDETGELAPNGRLTSFRGEPLVAYIAVNFLGYWADLGVTYSAGGGHPALLSEAEAGLRAMAAAARPGAGVGEMVQAAARAVDASRWPGALRYGLGNGIGLSLHTHPLIEPGSDARLVENTVISLRLRLADGSSPGALVSDLLYLTATGSESLFA